jgi:hypothetical protein
VEAYRSVIRVGSQQEANQARYEAARLLQKTPEGDAGAASLFEVLLATPSALPGLQPEIRLHLSRSLRRLEREAEADLLLREVVERWPATAAAELARGEMSVATQ